jgi:colanic acid/amylovoran biosynthesis glycosyltransferase
VHLLLVTTCFPYDGIHEFLDDEIWHLAEHFETITVAPLGPSGNLMSRLPANVIVDDRLGRIGRLKGTTESAFDKFRRNVFPATRRVRVRSGLTIREFRNSKHRLRLLKQWVLGRSQINRVRSWARTIQSPDMIYTFWLGPPTVGLKLAFRGTPIVSRVHRGDLYPDTYGWSVIPFQNEAIRSAILVAAVSEQGREHLASHFESVDTKVVVRRLGIRDIRRTDTESRPPESSCGATRLVSCSSLSPVKRVDLIMDVVAELGDRGVTVEWTHLGGGENLEELKKRGFNLPANVTIFLPGQLSPALCRSKLAGGEFDVFINLSSSEGAPVSLMEAQCLGLPVVATDVGGSQEVAPPSLNEIVELDASVSEIADAVVRARNLPDELRRERVLHWVNNYSAEVNYGAWARELASLAFR